MDWYPWGDEALRAARERGQAAVPLDRLLGLPLVPRHGARVLRGRRDRRDHERALRLHQGRPRGAARPRPDLHEGGPGDDRPRRLADERVPHARAGAVLRRHLLPARRPRTGMPGFDACSTAWPTPGDDRRDEIARTAASASSSQPARRRSAASRRGARSTPSAARRRRRRAARRRSTPPTAASAARRSSRPDRRSSSCSAGRDGDAETLDMVARRRSTHGRRRHLRPGRRRLPPLPRRRALARCRTSRRCSTTTRCSPAPTCTASR